MSHKKSIIFNAVVCCLIPVFSVQAVELQLASPSYQQCLEKSDALRRRQLCANYSRAAIATVSLLVTLRFIYNFIWGSEAPKNMPLQESDAPWFSLQTAQNVAWGFAKGCAYTICTQWVGQKLMADGGRPKQFISKHIYSYKNHCTEIERLLSLRGAPSSFANSPSLSHLRQGSGGQAELPTSPKGYDRTGATADRALNMDSVSSNCADIDLLIQAHLQGLIDKIELLMAYMISYAATHTSEHTKAQVDAYAQAALQKVDLAVALFNATYAQNFDEAVNECKNACTEPLTAAIRYALSTLPRDE